MQLLKHARVKYVLGDMCLARVILLPGDQGCLSSLTHTYTHTHTHTHTLTHTSKGSGSHSKGENSASRHVNSAY